MHRSLALRTPASAADRAWAWMALAPGRRVRDVSAETSCARFHKPYPRKRPLSREAGRRGTCTAALVLVGVCADRWRQVLKGLESKHRPLLSKVADATAGGAYLRSVISGPRDSFPPRLLPWILAGPPL